MSTDKKEPVSVILIAHNEAATIAGEVAAFYQVVVEKLPGSELIVAEDGSTDGTSELLRELATKLPIKLIQSKERKGYIRALLGALKLASRDWIFFSDTGGKFNPEEFWRLEALRSETDLIIGVKVKRLGPLYRRVMTGVFNMLVRNYFQVPVHDVDSGLRIYRRELVLKAIKSPLFFKDLVATEITLRMHALGARLAEVPVVSLRRKGVSRGMPPKKIPRVVVHILSLFPRLKRELFRLREGRQGLHLGK